MAERSRAAQSALKDVAYEGNDFASLLQKEFKPRSDEAKSAVEAGRAHAGAAGAGEHAR